MTDSHLGFIPEPITVPLDKLLPSHQVPERLAHSKKFKQILSSINAVGLIEPLTITKLNKASGVHLLLDGHLRMLALQDLGFTDAPCLVAKDDERYTYNNRINRLSTIQEHYMIRRAVERGVTAERLAKSLNIDIEHVTKKIKLLDGICAEAIGLLKDRTFSASLSPILRKLKPTRQIECVELMIASNNLTVPYAQALLAATPTNMLIRETIAKKIKGVSAEQMIKMEHEMANLEGQYKIIEQSYGQDVLNLVLAKGYLAKLLENETVIRYLSANHPDFLREFSSITEATGLDQ